MFETLPALCDRVVQWGLVSLIVFTPLAFGTVEAWAIILMEWGVTTLALIHILGRLWTSSGVDRGRLRATGLEFPLGVFLLLCALQTIPIPRAWNGKKCAEEQEYA